MINEADPGNLIFSMDRKNCNSFFTWVTSVLQFILDNNITDIKSKKSIIYNIYPQKDGIPIYNPEGKYLIKMYLMGKERKIVIDDTMPFNSDDEFILPCGSSLNV